MRDKRVEVGVRVGGKERDKRVEEGGRDMKGGGKIRE